MNFKKIVGMLNERTVNLSLMRSSIAWNIKSQKGYPDQNIILLWKRRWKMGSLMAALVVYTVITISLKSQTLVVDDGYPTPEMMVWMMFGVIIIIALVTYWQSAQWLDDNGIADIERYDDAKAFIKAISAVEEKLGRPIEQWNPSDRSPEMVCEYMPQDSRNTKMVQTANENAPRKPSANRNTGTVIPT
jgi:hypothetical protein